MLPSPIRRQPQASDAVIGGPPPMSPGSSGELSPFDLLGEIGDVGPGSPLDDGLDGNQNDGGCGQRWDGHTEIAEQAKHEAKIENRIAELRKEGFWTPRRLSKFPEPSRPKVQWDYLCEEMQWLSADFAQERRWKRGVARKVVRMVVRHHEELKQKEERARREEQAKLRRIATSIAKEVRQFWSNVEKVVQFKQQSRLEAKRKKALDLQLDFIVGQTEKYSDLLSQSLNETTPISKTTPTSKTSSSGVASSHGGSLRTSPTPSLCQKDGDFLPQADEEEEEDDEETIEMEERQDGNDEESHRRELELLKQESELPLDELLQSLPPEILQEEAELEGAESEDDDDDDSEEEELIVEGEDDEFTANEEEAEDEEETIAAEEALDGQQDHKEELSQLATEGEMSIEDLLQKYSLVRCDDEEKAELSDGSLPSDHTVSEYSECDSSDCESEGVEFLVKQEDEEGGTDQSQCEPPEPKKEITDIAATAESLQPKGYTLATTQVKTPVPFLLRGDLREYQHIGLEWLVTMYEKKLNGILADEMGLGKTIQTISLLAHLACDRGNWGPHLIIVPTSVILNWEMELKRWCPSFKILTYYGSQKERKLKRQGWTKANAFHVCITSYKLVLQDHQAFRRKNWRYLILDEAQNIKNFKSQRWQSLLNFNSQRRLLLTGTPLQNSLMELWSLMHFLMPHVFQSHREFKEWFSNPLSGMIEGSQEYNEGLVRRLHKVLRPFLLRRIKLDVEKQMPKKYEHVIYCRLSKRQRFLYDDFMSQAATRESLSSGHFMSVINILMQLRKVCNHPNLFDPRPIHSPFITSAICYSVPSLVLHALHRPPLEFLDTSLFDLVNMEGHVSRYESDVFLSRHKPTRQLIQEIADSPEPPPRPRPLKMKVNRMLHPVVKAESRSVMINSSRPVPKLQDPPMTPSPPPPPSTPLPLPQSNLIPPQSNLPLPPPQSNLPLPPPQSNPLLLPPQSNLPLPSAGASGAAHPTSQVSPLVQSSAVTMTNTPLSGSESGKASVLQNAQPVYSAPQRFILSPDMQARLPSGEVISLSQLASLSGRPLQSPSVTKPLTLQLQGAKFTLSGAQVRPMGVSQPRPMQGNVLHLVSSGGQHHLLSQPAQLALIQALAQQAASSAPAAAQLLQNNSAAQIGVQAMAVQGLQHSLLSSASLPQAAGPALATPGQVSSPGVVKIVVRQAPREVQSCPQRPPLAPQVRPILRVLPGAHVEQSNLRDALVDRAAPVVATSTITLASSPLLMVSSPTVTPRLASPSPMAPNTDDSASPLSGVALRLVAASTSPTLHLTNHHSSSPRHTGSPAIINSAPSNCTTTQLIGALDSSPSLGLQKSSQNLDSALLDGHPVQNGNGLQKQLGDSSAVAITCVPNSVNSPSPPASTVPKVSPPTYNLSLVPALIANSASTNTARFLTSPLSLLALSPLASSNSGPNPVIYTPPNAFPTLAAPSLSAPLPAASVSASLPLLAAPSLSAPLPAASGSASLPLLAAPSLSAPLLAAPSLSAPLPAASGSASLPLLAAPSLSAPLLSGQLTPFASPLPISSANQTTMTLPHPSVETPLALPVFSAASVGPVPALSTPTPTKLLAASAPMLEGSNNPPVLVSPDAPPLLDTTSGDTLPPLVLSTSLKLPSMASASLSILPTPASNALPLLAAASSKISMPLLGVTSASSNVPLVSASAATTNQAASVRASIMYTTCASSVTNSCSPLLATSNCLPSLLPKATAPLFTVQVKVPGLAEATTSMSAELAAPCTSSAELAAPCTSSAELAVPCTSSAEGPLLPSSALEPAMVSMLGASVPTPLISSIQSVVPTVQMKASTPLPSLSASTVTPSMPPSAPPPSMPPSAPPPSMLASAPPPSMLASAPLPSMLASAPAPLPSMPAFAPAPLPSLPASTPIPLPLLTASTPTPVSSLPASSPDPSAPGQASCILAPPMEPSSQLPSSGTNPLLLSASAPLSLTSSSAPLLDAKPSERTLPKPSPSHSNLSPSLRPANPTYRPDTEPTIPASLTNQESKNFPESSLSLSIAGPPPAGVTESEMSLEGEESRIAAGTTYNTAVRPRRLLPPPPRSPFYLEPLEERRKKQKMERLERIFHLNERRCSLSPVYGTEVLNICTLPHSSATNPTGRQTHALASSIFTSQQRLEQLQPIIERFIISMPPVEAPQITLHTSHPPPSMLLQESLFRETLSRELTPHTCCLHRIISNMRTQFPDLRLIQYDCGKLQTLHRLLRELKSGGHRVLLFTQMTRMLDVLEQFLNYHGHIYLRLDGSTRVEQRQVLMERFNMDKRIFCFILSTRSGGVGVNLTGADTVIFYDSDWNPTMDAQAQDRCHRIGQTRDVHIYRLVSERTVEENILKKAQQKRMLGDMAIEGGNFTTAYFKQQTIRELFDMEDLPRKESDMRSASPSHSTEEASALRPSHILEQALGRAEDEEDTLAASLVRAEQVADLAEFNENVPLEPEEEEQKRVEQEISALVEQLTPIERYAMYFLEASLEEVSREELKQAEEQVEAARKDLILAKDEGGQSIEEKWEEEVRKNRKVRTPTPARTPGERVGVRVSERLRGNKAADPTDIAESIVVPEVSLSTQEVHCEVSTPTLEGSSVPDADNGVHDADHGVRDADHGVRDAETSHNAAVPTELALSSIAPPIPQPEESSTEIVKEEAKDVVVAPMEEVPVPSAPVLLGSPEPCEQAPRSPVTTPKEEPTPPRTPRRKVTADCEILLAGAKESSPAAKVLRRLPGRLVTVVEERIPATRRHVRAKGHQATLDNGALSPNNPDCQSPPRDLLSEDNSETGSPPPKRKRGRPPKTPTEMSPTAVPDLPREDRSPPPPPPPTVISELSSPSILQTAASPKFSSKPNSENESSSTEKRKRGRPPKRQEGSPSTPPTTPPSFLGALPSSLMASPVGAKPPSPICASPKSPILASPPVVGGAERDPTQPGSTQAASISDPCSAPHNPAAKSIIPIDSFHIPSVSVEATSSSGADEPITPSKRRRGRPPRSQAVAKINSTVTPHNSKLDSSSDRSPSPKVTMRGGGKRKPLKADPTHSKEQNSSLADTDDSSEEEVAKRTPLTRSAWTRLETGQTLEMSPKPQRGRSPRVTPIPEKPATKKRKPPSTSSPSPPSSSPNGSSSGKLKVARKKHCSPPERVLRSSLTANPASNTRSSRSQLVYFPSSNRGRKAKT